MRLAGRLSASILIRLAAIREFFDRMLGKPPVAVDATVAKFDIVTPGEPAANATDRADTW